MANPVHCTMYYMHIIHIYIMHSCCVTITITISISISIMHTRTKVLS